MTVKKADSAQPFFDGFEPPPPSPKITARQRGTDAFFFALTPDPAAALLLHAAGQRLRSGLGLTGRLLKPENLHITLFPLGEYDGTPPEVLDLASAVGPTIKAAPFEIVFNSAMSFRRAANLPFVLRGDNGVTGASLLQKQFSDRLKPVIKGGSQTTPHMTLLYDQKLVERQPIEEVRFLADSFVLVHSRVGQGRHEILSRWPLSPPLQNAPSDPRRPS